MTVAENVIIMICLLSIVMMWKNPGVFWKVLLTRTRNPRFQGWFKIGDNLLTTDNELISNKFNDFFINIEPTLAKSIPHVNLGLLVIWAAV